MQTCSACLEVRPLSDFHRDKSKRLGVVSTCKECAKARARLWFSGNKERGKRQRQAWYKANRDKMIERFRAYRSTNYEACLRMQRRWRDDNKEIKRAADTAWHAANPEKTRLYRRVSEARRRATGGFHTAEDVDRIRKQQRGRCAICRSKLDDNEHIDHIKPLSKGGTSWPRNIQLLCEPCNLKKHARDPIDHMRSLGMLL